MAVNGERFMKISKTRTLLVSGHAMQRFAQFVGWTPTESLLWSLLRRSRQLTIEEMFARGHYPAYHRRRNAGQQSFYFRFVLFGQEMVAVLTEGVERNELVWVTIYRGYTQPWVAVAPEAAQEEMPAMAAGKAA